MMTVLPGELRSMVPYHGIVANGSCLCETAAGVDVNLIGLKY